MPGRQSLFWVLSSGALAIGRHLRDVQHFHAGVFEVESGFYGVTLVYINMQALVAQWLRLGSEVGTIPKNEEENVAWHAKKGPLPGLSI